MKEPDRYPLPSEGPWVGEPDHAAFEHLGFPCILHRNRLGAWCGYVGVPEGHPWFGKGYDDVHQLSPALDVHGGLTYAEPCRGAVCHDAPEKRWWLGFDCSHAMDVTPGLDGILEKARSQMSETARSVLGTLEADGSKEWFGEKVTYKDLAYVRAETERLAEQAKEAQP